MADELHLEKILELEFGYAQETAAEALEDRTTVVNFYLILAGALSSIALGLLQLEQGRVPFVSLTEETTGLLGARLPSLVYSLIFWLIGLLGFFTLMKLIRLRQAHQDSLKAMNRIKDFYKQRFPEVDAAFLWKTNTIPRADKPWTITFNLSLLVVLLDSLAIAVGVFFLDFKPAIWPWADEALAFVLAFVWQGWWYFWQLRASE